MAVLPVRTIGDPILEARAREVAGVDDRIRRLLDDMIDTMRVEKGIGLAAPQVGVGERLVVIEIGERVLKLVNPRIAAKRGKSRGLEACLSVPELDGDVERADWVKLEYLDETGAARELEAEGLLARCIQHELDHLDGILFVNRLSTARRMLLQKKIVALRQETRERLGGKLARAR